MKIKNKKTVIIAFFFLLMLIVAALPPMYRVSEFSYAGDYDVFSSWAKCSGFNNTSLCKVESAGKAVELAKNEATVEYNRINVSYDETEKVWRVTFYMEEYVGGTQRVYLNENGITLMRVNR
ncbi:MAG: hypothetical protein IJX24_03690 [Oscillospiraceae bacterium]|nr:hypothetical protein [Oscillospiraceae bacterium]